MRSLMALVVTPLVLAACTHTSAPPVADSTAAVAHADDSIIALRTQHAAAYVDTARRTVAVLLKHPETAVFDSLLVVQLPKTDGAWATPYVCGRMGGKPGIGGRNTPTPFIYQDRINVFVLDDKNGAAFAALRAKTCDNPAAHVLLK